MPMTRPTPDEYPTACADYVSRVPESDVLSALEAQIATVRDVFRSIPESRGGHRYAPGKWSIREIAGHLTDGERVFSYRALRFSRGDTTPLPGFDEEAFVARSTFDASTLADLVGEFGHQRQANLHFFRRLTPEQWTRRGTANQSSM